MDDMTIILLLASAGACAAVLLTARRVHRQRTRRQQENISLGDEIKTTGGIRGTVVSFNEKEVTIESGSKGSEIVVLREAVRHIDKRNAS